MVRFSSERTMRAKDNQFWQITIFPMSERVMKELNWTRKVSLATDKKHFPDVHGFALVEGFTLRKTDKGFESIVYNGALKIHGHTKRRRLRERIRAVVASSVQVEVRGIAGWDRLCKRILSESIEHAFQRGNIDAEVFEQDAAEYDFIVGKFLKNPDRQRRRLETYMEVKRGARRRNRGVTKLEGPRDGRKPQRPWDGRKPPGYKPDGRKPPDYKPP